MRFHYFLADGTEIDYSTWDPDNVSISDIDNLAMMYAQKRPNDLPDSVFINVKLLRSLSAMFGHSVTSTPMVGPVIVSIMTCAGPLKVVPKPYACDQCLLLVGKEEDFERYDLDKVFEEIVLADCERE